MKLADKSKNAACAFDARYPRNADVPEVAVWQSVQSCAQPGALAPLLKARANTS
jgi:hypothetical protein